jgi:hypothetical protein
MKTLAALRTEIERGMTVYPMTNHDLHVQHTGEEYVNSALKSDGLSLISMGYKTLDDLIVDDVAGIASQPVWSTAKPKE